jgi:hypothetical protein
MEPKKIRGWKELVSDLKEVRNFGIHGAQTKNVPAIFKDIPEIGCVWGHYFGADKKSRELNNSDFYQKLYASIGVAQGFSRAYKVESGKIEVIDDLTLILGICPNPDISLDNNLRSAPGFTSYGQTFPIGHDMSRLFNFYTLVLNKDELNEIDARAEKTRRIGKNFVCPYTGASYFIRNSIIEELLLKLKTTTRQHLEGTTKDTQVQAQ